MDPTLLRTALRANTASSLISGVALAVAAGPLADYSGVDGVALRVVGVGLIGRAATLFRSSAALLPSLGR